MHSKFVISSVWNRPYLNKSLIWVAWQRSVHSKFVMSLVGDGGGEDLSHVSSGGGGGLSDTCPQ